MNKTSQGDIILSFGAFFQIVVLMSQELLDSLNIITHESSRFACIVISAIPMIIAVIYVIRRRFLLLLNTYLIIIFLILQTLVFFPANEKYLIRGTFNILFVSIPCFLCIASLRDIFILKRIMLYLSYIIFALGIIYITLLWIGKMNFLSYSMTFSYYLLLPSMIFVNQKRIIFGFLFIIICIMMIMVGSRGALVTSLIYALLVFVFNRENRINLSLLMIVLVVGIVYGSFLNLFVNLTNEMGVTSRTLDLFLRGDIAQDTGRLPDYSIIWKEVLNSPFVGYGIFGDRVVLNGIYSHNFFLEVFHNFGIVFGSILILLLFLVIIRTFLTTDKENKRLLFMLFCYSFIPLMVSGSYLAHTGFALFMGSLVFSRKNVE